MRTPVGSDKFFITLTLEVSVGGLDLSSRESVGKAETPANVSRWGRSRVVGRGTPMFKLRFNVSISSGSNVAIAGENRDLNSISNFKP